MSRIVLGRVASRPGDRPYLEKFQVDSFTLPRSSTGGTATNFINLDLSYVGLDLTNIKVNIYGLRAATIWLPATSPMQLFYSTDGGVTTYLTTGFLSEAQIHGYGTATGARNAALTGLANSLHFDSAATFIYQSGTTTDNFGHALSLSIDRWAATDLQSIQYWSHFFSATVAGGARVYSARGSALAFTATIGLNGVRITGSGGVNFTNGTVEIWAERLNRRGIAP